MTCPLSIENKQCDNCGNYHYGSFHDESYCDIYDLMICPYKKGGVDCEHWVCEYIKVQEEYCERNKELVKDFEEYRALYEAEKLVRQKAEEEIQDAHALAFNLLPNREIDDMTDTLCEQIQVLQTAFDNHTQELRKNMIYLANRVKDLSQCQIPKCWQIVLDNNLIQNKVITVGMCVYFLLPNGQSYTILEDKVQSINIDKDNVYVYLEKYTSKQPQELYSTREAAEAAREK